AAVVLGGEERATVVLRHQPHGLLQARVRREAERRAGAQQADRLADGVLVEDASDRCTGGFLEVGQLLVGDLGFHDPSVASAWVEALDAGRTGARPRSKCQRHSAREPRGSPGRSSEGPCSAAQRRRHAPPGEALSADHAVPHGTGVALFAGNRPPPLAKGGDMRRLWLPVLGFVAGLTLPAHAAPDAIVFTLSHADCGPTRQAGDNRFRLFMNGTLLADVPTSVGCVQSDTPLVVTIMDPTALAGFDPAACNSFRVDMTTEDF